MIDIDNPGLTLVAGPDDADGGVIVSGNEANKTGEANKRTVGLGDAANLPAIDLAEMGASTGTC